jgi:biotin carboxyl carrier protein
VLRVISRICAQNEEIVEYGQVLAVIDPERAG